MLNAAPEMSLFCSTMFRKNILGIYGFEFVAKKKSNALKASTRLMNSKLHEHHSCKILNLFSAIGKIIYSYSLHELTVLLP